MRSEASETTSEILHCVQDDKISNKDIDSGSRNSPPNQPSCRSLEAAGFISIKNLAQIVQTDLQLPFFHELQLRQIRYDHLPRPWTGD